MLAPSSALRFLLAPLLSASIALIAALWTTGSRARRTLGVLLGVTAMLPPWLLPARPCVVRAVLTLVAFAGTMRVADLARVAWPWPRRVLHVLSAIDSRRLARRAPRLEAAALVEVVAWAALAAAGLVALGAAPRGVGTAHWIVRWTAGVVAVYAAIAGAYRALFAAYSALGFDTPPLHVAPVRARSVQELWGERWARPISEWLASTFFRPYARRRRPRTGVLLAFVVSAAFHAYAIHVGLGFWAGLTMAAWTAGYFLAQGAVMALEHVLGVRRWPPWAGHVWTAAWMLALAPLFIEPVARLMGYP